MFAFINYAGGCMEYRMYRNQDGSIRVDHFCLRSNPDETTEMKKDGESTPYQTIHDAMLDIANKIG